MLTTKPKKIVFTGGGTAGHVTPNLALIEKFQKEDWEINYIGSKNGIEKELVRKAQIPYHSISTGKLRRYFSYQNFFDPFKIILGIVQALVLCLKLKPKVIFSKGGFVSFPVVIAGWILRIPILIHESDLTVGLANKLCFPFATKICVTFQDTALKIVSQQKVVITGTPIRQDFFTGTADQGRKICNFLPGKKVITIFGGSQGAEKINQLIRELLPKLLSDFQIAHICGHNKVDSNHQEPGYKQFAYLDTEFPNVLAASDLVISRAGANSIYELIALGKPNILLPLAKGSRGDQIDNANYCKQAGFSALILEEQLTADSLLDVIRQAIEDSQKMILAMKKIQILPAVSIIYKLINQSLS